MLPRRIPEASQDRGAVRMTAGDRQSPSTALLFVMPGLDPGIHPLRKMHCYEDGWIAGSSPAMTVRDQTFST